MIKILLIAVINDQLIGLKALIKNSFPDSSVITSLKGPDAVELALVTDPDVILLDNAMGVLDQLEACEEFKNNDRLSDIPVVFLTSIKAKVSKIKALEMGAEGFLSKPIDESELIAQIKAMVKIKSANRLMRQENEKLSNLVISPPQELDQSQITKLQLLDNLITENTTIRKAEEDLKLAFQQIEFHENNSPLAVIEFNDKLLITKWSKNAQNIFGWQAEEVLGKNIVELKWVYEEDAERVALSTHLFLSSKTSNCITNRNYTKNGSVITCEWYNSAMIGADGELISVHSLVLDITERKRAEESLKQSNEFKQTLLQAIPFGMNIVDENGDILFINEIQKKQLDEEFLGKKCWTVFRDNEIRCLACPLDSEIIIGKTTLIKSEGLLAGRVFQISHTGMLFNGKKATLEIFQDVTERKQIESELIHAKEKAEESDQLKSSFLANMSHEIRTPLNSIIGFSEMLTDPDCDQTQQFHIARIIHSSGNNLLNIINNILDISKLEAGQVQISKKLFSVKKLFADIEKEYSFKSIEKGIDFIAQIPGSVQEVLILSDEGMIRQVLDNFVSNSLKFTKQGCIRLGIKKYDDIIEFMVKDTGIGIPAEFHEKIFEHFRQLEAVNTKTHGGNGLGLAISKGLVNLLGGKIWMESEKGKGSAFYFSIPIL